MQRFTHNSSVNAVNNWVWTWPLENSEKSQWILTLVEPSTLDPITEFVVGVRCKCFCIGGMEDVMGDEVVGVIRSGSPWTQLL
ncbi:hypothetical protein XELAEV_18034474mg [Xenopus laevis]|uniref:Uncharacterized protein n=1 Tax=Xenopus laevis TaxID=8355 RepID=A0A974CE24_XENLA|nr:hypothetical protein XELAEV_18034474mg [Xenopus laevis]